MLQIETAEADRQDEDSKEDRQPDVEMGWVDVRQIFSESRAD